MSVSTSFGIGATLKDAIIQVSATATIVAAVPGYRIIVCGYTLMASGTVNVKFQSHTTPTDLTGLLYLIANTGASPAINPAGLFATLVGEALDLNLSAGIAVGGHLNYILSI